MLMTIWHLLGQIGPHVLVPTDSASPQSSSGAGGVGTTAGGPCLAESLGNELLCSCSCCCSPHRLEIHHFEAQQLGVCLSFSVKNPAQSHRSRSLRGGILSAPTPGQLFVFSAPTEFSFIHFNAALTVIWDVCVSGDLDLFLAPESFYTVISKLVFVISP